MTENIFAIISLSYFLFIFFIYLLIKKQKKKNLEML